MSVLLVLYCQVQSLLWTKTSGVDESNFVDVYWQLNWPYVVTMGIKSIKLLPFTYAVVMTWGAHHSTAAGHATVCSSVSVTYFGLQTHTNVHRRTHIQAQK